MIAGASVVDVRGAVVLELPEQFEVCSRFSLCDVDLKWNCSAAVANNNLLTKMPTNCDTSFD